MTDPTCTIPGPAGTPVDVPADQARQAIAILGEGIVLGAHFAADVYPFASLSALEGWIARRRWSLGALQGPEPIGVLARAGVVVAKWRNLGAPARRGLDGLVLWEGQLPQHRTARLYLRPGLDTTPRGRGAR